MNDMEVRLIVSSFEASCFLCKWILEDLNASGKLTGYPLDSVGAGTFPVQGKLKHLELERLSIDNHRSKNV